MLFRKHPQSFPYVPILSETFYGSNLSIKVRGTHSILLLFRVQDTMNTASKVLHMADFCFLTSKDSVKNNYVKGLPGVPIHVYIDATLEPKTSTLTPILRIDNKLEKFVLRASAHTTIITLAPNLKLLNSSSALMGTRREHSVKATSKTSSLMESNTVSVHIWQHSDD
ncbi:hypothetical protein BC830DRAFT_1137835 [Chytriomyces sp. MP71]|nr:hypothetical protein BC830DRAFT_1137835 [Chytriomyces sp. MP71]